MMYHPSEIELGETLKKIKEAVERVKPSRLVVDSLTEIRLQAQTPLRYRREVLSLRQFLRQQGCTALLLDELREEMTAQSVVYGIIEMHRHAPDFGPARRRIQVTKMRGVKFWEGYHDYVIQRGGIEVFPGWWRRSTGKKAIAGSSAVGCPDWTPCWAEACPAARRPCWSARQGRASLPPPRNLYSTPLDKANVRRSSPSTRRCRAT